MTRGIDSIHDPNKPVIALLEPGPVVTIATLSKFVIADLSNPKCVPHELQLIVPNLPSLPIQPILVEGEEAFATFEHLQHFQWVNDVLEYKETEIETLVESIITMCKKA